VLRFPQELQAQIELRRPEVEQLTGQVRDDVRADDLIGVTSPVERRFERVCVGAGAWQARMQTALVQCRQFDSTIENLHDWLERIDRHLRAVEPIDLSACQARLTEQLSQLQVAISRV